jgi:hypothetical protein
MAVPVSDAFCGEGHIFTSLQEIDLRPDQPKPQGRRAAALRAPRPVVEPARGARDHRLVTLVSGIADRMGVKTEADAGLEEITRDVAPEAVLGELEEIQPGAEQH